MSHRLILMLGKGQSALVNNSRHLDYRMARYYFPNAPDRICETPFLGEALASLYEGETLDQLHILGTRDSMWDTLYAHCIGEALDDAAWQRFLRLSGNVREGRPYEAEDLRAVASAFADRVGIPTQCQLIDIGRSDEEIWNIFDAIIRIPKAGDRVSMDITHGLRFQPFLLMLTLAYFRAAQRDLEIGHVFYGALELSKDYFNGNTPIFDLRPMLELIDWLDAANAFNHYGDLGPLSRLLQMQQMPPAFIEQAREFARSLQLSDTARMRTVANLFLSQLNQLERKEGQNLRPLQLVSELLKAYPRRLVNSQSEWQLMLGIAGGHLRYDGQIGLAVIATWEAVIARLALLYQVDNRQLNTYMRLGRIATSPDLSVALPPEIREFPKKAQRLRAFRNAIAHIKRDERFRIEDIPDEFPDLYAYMRQHLPHPEWAQVPQVIAF